jgi:pantetheine-phosphate adenylyltransferase
VQTTKGSGASISRANKEGSSVAIFPGSFDPLTNGHIDIATRALALFDRVVIAVLSNPEKHLLFSVEERIALLKSELASDQERVHITSFSGLLVDFASSVGARVIVRGLRAVSDYDYEAQMALMNRSLSQDIETVFLVTREENSYISSSLVKQVAAMGGDVSRFVPARVARALREKIHSKA